MSDARYLACPDFYGFGDYRIRDGVRCFLEIPEAVALLNTQHERLERATALLKQMQLADDGKAERVLRAELDEMVEELEAPDGSQ